MNTPMVWLWNGEAMEPHERFVARANQEFVVGEHYRLAAVEERSTKTHSHYFASLQEAWMNLPEHEAQRFATAEHLRKWCLIKAGFSDERSIVCATKAEAQRMASFIRPLDEYAIVVPSEAVVTVYTAKSQALKAMGKADFQRSKEMVLEIAWGLVGVTQEDAAQHVGTAA